MKAGLIRLTACSLGLLCLATGNYLPVASAQEISSEAYPPQRLDQLLAPIALYPDPLLAQILMASTYPLEVVEAARWVQDPGNAPLRGAQLDSALQLISWDPSVKSLVPFPQILQMMNSRLDWTQALGNAFLAQQSGVMDSVQRLRAEARTAGTLQSTPQETVLMQGPIVVIQPTDPQLVYVPYYNPTIIYGRWGYPDYPPVYFPPPPNYGYVAGPGVYFGVGFGVIGALWGWDQWNWGHHDIHIDAERYNTINNYAIAHDNRPRYNGNGSSWQHDPAQRRGVPYGNTVVQQRFRPAVAGATDTRRDFRGFDNRTAMPTARIPAPIRQVAPNPAHAAPPQFQPAPTATIGRAASPPQAMVRPVAPAFSSFGNGSTVRAQSQRGQASRQATAPAAASRPQNRAPSGGGQQRGGNEKGRR